MTFLYNLIFANYICKLLLILLLNIYILSNLKMCPMPVFFIIFLYLSTFSFLISVINYNCTQTPLWSTDLHFACITSKIYIKKNNNTALYMFFCFNCNSYPLYIAAEEGQKSYFCSTYLQNLPFALHLSLISHITCITSVQSQLILKEKRGSSKKLFSSLTTGQKN